MYTKKIQVSRGIFHGIPLESDRRCSTCRNGQTTEDVRKIRFDFLLGYQTFFHRIGRISEDILFKQYSTFSMFTYYTWLKMGFIFFAFTLVSLNSVLSVHSSHVYK